MSKKQVFLIVFSVALLFPLTSNSEAKLWDLVIEANVENSPLYSGERPIVKGWIVDHASKPVHNATVNIKSESMSIFTTTSQSGEFQAELGKHDRMAGNYIVNIEATSFDGKTGISSIQFQIRGDMAHVTANHAKISTPEAQKYLEASPDDFENNPVGLMLYNYYQKVYQDYLQDEELSEQITLERTLTEKQREDAVQQRLKAIEGFNPTYGVFSGPEYENYVNSLNESVRDTVVEHLNFTKNLFEEAQELRFEILKNGGSAEAAQAAYLEKLTVTRAMIEDINNNSTSNSRNNSSDYVENEEEDSDLVSNYTPSLAGGYVHESALTEDPLYQDAGLPVVDKVSDEALYQDAGLPVVDKMLESAIQVDVDGINVQINYIESIFYVNVNGTILEFLVNGTDITRVNVN